MSFSCSLGSFNTLSTLAAQLVGPFGYSADDASIFGVACTICGVLGALVMSVIVGLTGKHKPVLTTCCVLCVLFALLAALTVIYVGDGPGGLELLALAFGGLGFSAMPLMPISFEAAIMVSQAGEGTLAGLCMSGGQILGIGRSSSSFSSSSSSSASSSASSLCYYVSMVVFIVVVFVVLVVLVLAVFIKIARL